MKTFLIVYLPAVFVLAALTITTVNPLALPTHRIRLLMILPMLGFVILFFGSLLGGFIIYMMDEQEYGKKFAIGGVVATLVFSFAISHLAREQIISSVGAKRGKAAAARVAAKEQAYKHPGYNDTGDGGYLAHFLRKDSELDALRKAYFAGYNGEFQGRYVDLVDADALKQEGYQDGYQHAAALARNAAYGGQAAGVQPIEERIRERIEERELPVYIEGYEAGWKAAWGG